MFFHGNDYKTAFWISNYAHFSKMKDTRYREILKPLYLTLNSYAVWCKRKFFPRIKSLCYEWPVQVTNKLFFLLVPPPWGSGHRSIPPSSHRTLGFKPWWMDKLMAAWMDSTGELVCKPWHINPMEYDSAVKGKELQMHIQHGWNSSAFCWKELESKGYIKRHARKGTERKSVVARGQRWGKYYLQRGTRECGKVKWFLVSITALVMQLHVYWKCTQKRIDFTTCKLYLNKPGYKA